MGWNVKNDPVTGFMKFSLVDDDGDLVAAFRMNPMDVRLFGRLEEVSAYFAEQSKSAPASPTPAELQAYNEALEDKINYLIGGKSSLFDQISAVTIMPSGDLFAVEVLDLIYTATEPVAKERKQKMEAAMLRHTAKYS